ncbi:MAG TPA: TlyA family RNA methyltransferase [Blastocatellia bacterium]|nr:TlyA family RNA methyltransferase [Blastocatellia bacterium]
MTKHRIDNILVERGLAETRSKAQALVLAGSVLVENQRVDKPGKLFDPGSEIRLKDAPTKYVSRGGLKLEAALTQFQIGAANKICLDIGASTGGFTDCLVQHGAKSVWALDVGHNQLAWKIRNDPRVVVIEGQNVRDLNPNQFDAAFAIVTMDVSFISLTKALPAVPPLLSGDSDIVALIKPQFEVGKGQVGKGGIVKDPEKHREVIRKIAEFADSIGLTTAGLIESPILGAEGNREFLIHLKKGSANAGLSPEIEEQIMKVVDSRPTIVA